jgi:DNA-binding transcriptional MerR regulator
MNTEPSYSLNDLCLLAELPARTVRYYVQAGLVDRPLGETRSARYGARHLEQLLLTRKWSAAGLSLERIRALLHEAEAPPALPPRAAGSIAVCSHLQVADGVEIVIDPGRAGWTPEQLRAFAKGVAELHVRITHSTHGETE